MSEAGSVPVTIRVLDKEYQIACPPSEREALLESARYLNEKMLEIRDTRKMVGSERVAIMAALNITHDLLKSQSGDSDDGGVKTRLRGIQTKVEAALSRGRQMEL